MINKLTAWLMGQSYVAQAPQIQPNTASVAQAVYGYGAVAYPVALSGEYDDNYYTVAKTIATANLPTSVAAPVPAPGVVYGGGVASYMSSNAPNGGGSC